MFAQAENAFLLKSPLYLREFLLKLEIPANRLVGDLPHIVIRSAVEGQGMAVVRNHAEKAKDDYSGAPYFGIRDDKGLTVIGRRYALEHGYMTIELFLYKGKTGAYEHASITFSQMSVD